MLLKWFMFCAYTYINCKYLNSVIWILKNDVRCSIVLEKLNLKKHRFLDSAIQRDLDTIWVM